MLQVRDRQVQELQEAKDREIALKDQEIAVKDREIAEKNQQLLRDMDRGRQKFIAHVMHSPHYVM